MTSDDSRALDPDRVASRSFATAFRGYDQDEVRDFLEGIARDLRLLQDSKLASTENLERLTRERDQLQEAVAELEARTSELTARAEALEEAAAAQVESSPGSVTAGPVELSEMDEATLTQVLGAETVRVLETARNAAHGITTKAEQEAADRLAALEERETAFEADLEIRRADSERDLAALVASAEEEAERIRSEAAAAVATEREEAETAVTALRKSAEDEAAALAESASSEAAKTRTEAEKAATRLRSDAEAEAARLRADAQADAEAAQDTARETARQMLTEAQVVREKVLSDLVKKRRIGRQQLDQVKAARDRLARSLAVVRRELDEAMGELSASVPEARAAMEAVGRRVPESLDRRHAVELAAQLDSARDAGEPVIEVPDQPEAEDDESSGTDQASETAAAAHVEEAEVVADIDALFDQLAGGGSRRAAADEPDEVQDVDSAEEVEATESVEPVEAATETIESAESDEQAASAGTDIAAADTTSDEATPDEAVEEPEAGEAGDDEPQGDDLPEVFQQRDVAMTRFGPDLRRRLKRALADDQSAVLDGLRRAKGDISVDDLPDPEESRLRLVEAMADAAGSLAAAGAETFGGRSSKSEVDALVERCAQRFSEPLRGRVERAVANAAGDRTDALDPIRANYRDARANDLPQLADDLLADAFALGVYGALPEEASVMWVADPRTEPGPECYDNTLAGVVTKGQEFPTGHRLPPGSSGCRCLVLPAD